MKKIIVGIMVASTFAVPAYAETEPLCPEDHHYIMFEDGSAECYSNEVSANRDVEGLTEEEAEAMLEAADALDARKEESIQRQTEMWANVDKAVADGKSEVFVRVTPATEAVEEVSETELPGLPHTGV